MTESLLRKASLSERAVSPARVLLEPHRVSSNLMRVTAFSLGVALALLNETRAEAADLGGQTLSPSLTRTPIGDPWTGFYIGGNLGYATARSNWSATQPGGAPNLSGSLDLFRAFDAFNGGGSHFGGLQAGYNYMFPSRLVVGVEADVSFPSSFDGGQSFSSPVIGAANFSDAILMFGTARSRIGYDVNHWLYYATGGFAWTYDQFTRSQLISSPVGGAPAGTAETSFLGRIGWTVGAGVEAPIAPGWTAKLEYLYSQYGNPGVTFPLGAQRFDSDVSMHEVRWGLNYKLGGEGSNANGFLTSAAGGRELEPSQPNDLCGPVRISVSDALPRPEQSRFKRGTRDVGFHALCRVAAVGGCRPVDQSGD